MSNPKHPIITFRVKLDRLRDEKVGPLTNQKSVNLLHPDMHDNSPDRGRTNSVNHDTQEVAWLPGFLRGENLYVNDDGTFVAYGEKAAYLKRTYVGGSLDYLEVVSVTSESESA